MTSDFDDELRAHFDVARDADLPAGSFDRLVDRLDAPLAPLRARRMPKLLALAAAIVLIAGVAAVAAAQGGGDHPQSVHSVDDPTSTTGATTTSTTRPHHTTTTERVPGSTTTTTPGTTTSTTEPTVERDGRPDTIAAVVDPDGDGAGSLVVLDSSTGKVLRTLVADQVVDDVDVAPDGTIYYESDRSVVALDPDSGEQLATYPHMRSPEVSPHGSQLASFDHVLGTVSRLELASRQRKNILGDMGGNVPGQLAWSRDGGILAIEDVGPFESPDQGDGPPSLRRVILTDPNPYDDQIDMIDESFAHGIDDAASPVFPADGSLLVVSDLSQDGRHVVGDRMDAWDLASGQKLGEVSVSDVSGLDASADGQWVIATREGKRPHVVMTPAAAGDLQDLSRAPEGIIAAAW
ncbi:MAG: hypothetical protein JO291_04175 [Acidimicrobiia bacterium]|nr:hypothetical protein [Acidimicrobiia bacterium]